MTGCIRSKILEVLQPHSVGVYAETTRFRLSDNLCRQNENPRPPVPERWNQSFKKEESWHSEGVRMKAIKNCLMHFWIDEEKKLVQVFAVIYARRDQVSALTSMEM